MEGRFLTEKLSMKKLRVLVNRTRSGDLEAFGRIVRRFQDMAYGYAYSILGDSHLAEHAAQEAFLEAYRQLPNLRKPEAVWSSHTGDIACDHCHRYKEDVSAMKDIGLHACRLSIITNPKGLEFYDRLGHQKGQYAPRGASIHRKKQKNA